jgi:hypothetical protein
MQEIHHHANFAGGTRVLLLTARHKDGCAAERKIFRISHDAVQFSKLLAELQELMKPGERIYASVGARDVAKAARLFKHRMIDAEYDQRPLEFYENLQARWVSCLMDEKAQASKDWIFDIDDPARGLEAANILRHLAEVYVYDTKNGVHMVTQPFDLKELPDWLKACLHRNAMMLWGWR